MDAVKKNLFWVVCGVIFLVILGLYFILVAPVISSYTNIMGEY